MKLFAIEVNIHLLNCPFTFRHVIEINKLLVRLDYFEHIQNADCCRFESSN